MDKSSQMNFQAKIFIQPTLSPCAENAATSMYQEAKRSIKSEYNNLEIHMQFWPINSAEARRLGAYQVGTLFIEEKKVLEGYYGKSDVERELRKHVEAKHRL